MEDHLVQPDLGRVGVPQVLVVGDEVRALGQPQLDEVRLPVEAHEADEREQRQQEGGDYD